MEFSTERIIKLTDAQNAIPTRDGKLYAELFRHGTLTVEIYAPRALTCSSLTHATNFILSLLAMAGFPSKAIAFRSVPATLSLRLRARCIALKISLKTC